MAGASLGGFGCEELKSRREIQRGNEHYNEGRYQKAVEQFEPALQRTPDLDVGHHNAGLAYYKLFQPGDEKPENLAIAQKSADHFQAYLKAHPDDSKIIGLLTQLWIDSDQFEKALAYWEEELGRDPSNRDVIVKLANINRQAGRYAEARAWHEKRAALEPNNEGKVNAYLDIAQLEYSRLMKPDLVDEGRLEAADQGIAALQKAETIDPKHPLVQSLLGSMYQHRSMAHGALWARLVDTASQRHHQIKFIELQKAAAPAAAAEAAKPTPTPAPQASDKPAAP